MVLFAAGITAQSVAVIGTFSTTAVLGLLALVRGSKGDKNLTATSMLNATWTHTSNLVDQLQEENGRHRQQVMDCESKCAEIKAINELALNELAILKRNQVRLEAEIESLKVDRARMRIEIEGLGL